MAQEKQSTALVTNLKDRVDGLEAYLMERKEVLTAICPSPQRMIHLALGIGRRTPRLLECEPFSWINALLDASFFGIEPNPQLGHAYLIPYRNRKRGVFEAQYMIGYKGLILLATSPETGVHDITSRVVYTGDEFELHYENEWDGRPPFVHRPMMIRDKDQEMTDVYAFARGTGLRKFIWLPREGKQSVEYYRAKSRAANDGPWISSYEAMAMKTGIRRLIDHVPVKPQSKLAASIQHETAFEEDAPIHAFEFMEKTGKVEAQELAEQTTEPPPAPEHPY